MDARYRFIAKKIDRTWRVYDRDLASFPYARPGIGPIAQDHATEAAAQAEADRLDQLYRRRTAA